MVLDARVSRWLVTLRWSVFALLAVTLPAGEYLLGFHVSYAAALAAIAVGLGGHALLSRWSSAQAWIAVTLDLVVIAIVLALSGGAANPFSAVFFVYVALAASILTPRATFAVSALAAGLFGSLFMLPSGSCCPSHPANDGFSAHLYGMWLAFVAGAALVAYFSTRVRRALEEREEELARLRRESEQAARFAALGTLAAGTAHELATPLATIAVLAGEIRDDASSDEARRHAGVIAAQVTRCRDVITRMQAGAQRAGASAARASSLALGVRRAVDAWSAAHPEVAVLLSDGDISAQVPLSESDVENAVCALLDNALHATAAARSSEPIRIGLGRDPGGVSVSIEDGGAGVPPELIDRLGEPFLTTKEPGEGMGLGLYLVRTLLEAVGGRLDIERRAPAGTRVTLRLADAGA